MYATQRRYKWSTTSSKEELSEHPYLRSLMRKIFIASLGHKYSGWWKTVWQKKKVRERERVGKIEEKTQNEIEKLKK